MVPDAGGAAVGHQVEVSRAARLGRRAGVRRWLDTVTVARVRSLPTPVTDGWTPPDGIDVPEWGVDDTT